MHLGQHDEQSCCGVVGDAGAHDDAAGVHDLGWRLCAGSAGTVGMGIAIAAGTATVYAGLPEASSHRQLASLGQASRM